jgi:hypothetical protein
MHSFFVDNIDNSILNLDSPASRVGVRAAYDELNNEALFTFYNAKTTYNTSPSSFQAYAPILNGIMPEGSLVTVPEQTNILDENGNVIKTIDKEIAYDVIQPYPIVPGGTLVDPPYQNTDYLKRRPTYLQHDFTLCYSEILDTWSAFYDFKPSIYINTKSRLLTPFEDAEERLYTHNVGNYNKWYEVDFKTHLKVVCNMGPDSTKVFDNVSWHSTSKSKSGAEGQKFDQITFDTYYAYNDYQHTGILDLDLSLVPANLRRVEREWQMPIPRNVVTETGTDIDVLNPNNWDLTKVFADRIRDKYLIQHFEFDNSNTDQFVLDYINTYFRVSMR